jgi:hypothetical protein
MQPISILFDRPLSKSRTVETLGQIVRGIQENEVREGTRHPFQDLEHIAVDGSVQYIL